MAKNEIAKTENEKKFDLVTLEGEMAAAVAEELDGLGPIPFDKVKIPSGGGLAFEIPGENEDDPETTNQIVGVILYHYPVNAYWAENYSGGNNPPDCASLDGKRGVDRETGTVRDCKTCQYNQYGSSDNGNGKACKNNHRCFILRDGSPIPLLLTLPPTSLKGLNNYLGKQILLKNMRSYMAVSKITLKKEKSAGGITYSKAVFGFVERLSDEQIAKTLSMAEQLKAMTQPEIVSDEYKARKKVDQDMEFAATDEIIDHMEELPPEFVDC